MVRIPSDPGGQKGADGGRRLPLAVRWSSGGRAMTESKEETRLSRLQGKLSFSFFSSFRNVPLHITHL